MSAFNTSKVSQADDDEAVDLGGLPPVKCPYEGAGEQTTTTLRQMGIPTAKEFMKRRMIQNFSAIKSKE